MKILNTLLLLLLMSQTSNVFAATLSVEPSKRGGATACISYPNKIYAGEIITLKSCAITPEGILTELKLSIFIDGRFVAGNLGDLTQRSINFPVSLGKQISFAISVANTRQNLNSIHDITYAQSGALTILPRASQARDEPSLVHSVTPCYPHYPSVIINPCDRIAIVKINKLK